MNKLKESEILFGGDAETDALTDEPQGSISPPYLKLIVDCWECIFDYLSFRDILVMGQTCKRMNQVAGYYIREYHPDLRFEFTKGEIIVSHPHISLQTDFYKFITKLYIENTEQLDFFQSMKTFDLLKTIVFRFCQLTENQIECMFNVLQNVETISLEHCSTNSNTFKQMAVSCSKLKSLNVQYCGNENGSYNTLFSINFPMLERLRFRSLENNTNLRIDELKMFLENHVNIKQFDVDWYFLWENRNSLIQTSIRLDLLSVCFDVSKILMPSDQLVNFLKTFYVRGFYKTLQIQFLRNPKNVDYEYLNNMFLSLAPALEKLLIPDDSFINFSPLINLKQLHIGAKFPTFVNIESLAKSMIKLERLLFTYIKIDKILPFIRHSKNLKTIKFHNLSEYILDTFALNQERKKFGNIRPVTIYMRNDIYLRTKWKSRNLNLNLIQIKRLDSNEYYFNW